MDDFEVETFVVLIIICAVGSEPVMTHDSSFTRKSP